MPILQNAKSTTTIENGKVIITPIITPTEINLADYISQKQAQIDTLTLNFKTQSDALIAELNNLIPVAPVEPTDIQP